LPKRVMMYKHAMQKILLGITLTTLSYISSSVPTIPLSVIFGNPEKTLPAISPDGKQLAYCAPHNGVLNIWVKTLGTDDARVVTHEAHHGILAYTWSSQGPQLLYKQDNNGDENFHIFSVDLETGAIKDLTPFAGVKVEILTLNKKFPDEALILMNKRDPRLFDVYKLNYVTGDLLLVEENPGTIIWWLADGNFTVRAAIANNPDVSQTLLVKHGGKDEPWQPALELEFEDTLKDELYCGLLAFSKDGKDLFINSSFGHNTRSLSRFNLETHRSTLIATDDIYDCTSVIFNDDTGEPDIVFCQKERLYGTAYGHQATKDLTFIKNLSTGDLNYIKKSDDGSLWVVGFLYDNKSQDYYLYRPNQQKAEFLWSSRPELDTYQLATTQPISLQSRDGLTLHGYLTCPLDKELKNMPVVLLVHGGPFSRDKWGFAPEVQWLANRGYACLQINFRGSAGYGKKFLAGGNGEYAGKMHDDLIDAVQWAINTGIADPERIAIYGGSYGGYAALVGATFTPDVFCCAVDIVGPSSLLTTIQTMPPYWARAPWEKRMGSLTDIEFLKSRSPLYKIDNIKIPLMIAQGAHDVRVRQSESEQIVAALQKKGIPHEYLLFKDEGHGFKRPENRMIFYEAAEKFLEKNMR